MNPIITSITKKVDELEKKKSYINHLQKLSSYSYLHDEELNEIENELKSQINEMQSLNNSSLENLLKKHDIDVKQLEGKGHNFLIDGLIIDQDITLFAAAPGEGKSLLLLLIAHKCLFENLVEKAIFFDMDNGLTTLQDRNLYSIKQKFPDRLTYIHESTASLDQMLNLMDQIAHKDLTSSLIVIDSGKNFVRGDRDKNMDVSQSWKRFKLLRKAGAAVVVLHHTNKQYMDKEIKYAGSSAWVEDTANAFYLKRNDYRKALICEPFKNRVGKINPIAYSYDLKSFQFSQIDLEWAIQTKDEEEIINSLIEFIKHYDGNPTWSQLISYSKELGINKDRAHQIIKSGKNKYWKATKVPEKNFRDEFEIIVSDNPDKSDKPYINQEKTI